MLLTRPEGSSPEDLHLSRRGLAGLLAGGYAVAAVSADAQPITTDATGLVTETTAIPDGGVSLPAFVARPAGGGRHPAVIVVNEVFGIHEYIRDVCRRFAKLGYVAIAPAYFFRADPDNRLPATTDFPQIMKVVATAKNEQVMGDTGAALQWLAGQPFVDKARLGITGFCWGGGAVWMAAARFPQLKAGVAWYGRLAPAHTPPAPGAPPAEVRPWPVDIARDLKAPMLGLYGGLDKGIPPEDIAAMRAALKAAGKTDSEIVVYPGAQHGFHADYRPSYDPTAAQDGWKRLLAHFAAHGVKANAMARAA